MQKQTFGSILGLKFSFSEKATIFFAILLMVLTFTIVNVKTIKRMAHIFVVFTEKLNFKAVTLCELWNLKVIWKHELTVG